MTARNRLLSMCYASLAPVGQAPDSEGQLLRERIEAPCKQQEIYRNFFSRKLNRQNHGYAASPQACICHSGLVADRGHNNHLSSPRQEQSPAQQPTPGFGHTPEGYPFIHESRFTSRSRKLHSSS